LEDNSIHGAQGILINVCGSSTLSLHEIHEASSVIQQAAHENANIIFGAVLDEGMKESVKITVIAAGFREVQRKQPGQRQSYLPKTWKATREIEPQIEREEEPEVVHAATAAAGAGAGSSSSSSSPRTASQPQQSQRPEPPVVRETGPQVQADDLEVPTFLRRQATQKA